MNEKYILLSLTTFINENNDCHEIYQMHGNLSQLHVNTNVKLNLFNSGFELSFGESLEHRNKEKSRLKLRSLFTTYRRTDLGTLVALFVRCAY